MNKPDRTSAARRWAALLACLLVAAPALALTVTSTGSAAPAANSTDLAIAKSDSPDPVRAGATLTYSIRIDNLGPLAASGVTVTDTLPRDVDLVSATATTGSCTSKGRKVTCGLGSVGTGVNYAIPAGATIVVIPRRAGIITNTATVKGEQKDPLDRNNRVTIATRVLGAASCRGLTATVTGTAGNDVLAGTGGPDVIAALGGDDRIFSLSGRDLICAGAGHDSVFAGSAADRVFAGPGRDRVLGRGGPDLLRGAGGEDRLKGGPGADRLRGGRGRDVCRGGPGADSLRGCER